jgi:hypothetical protein
LQSIPQSPRNTLKGLFPWVVVLAILAGTLLMRYSFIGGSDENDEPAHLPFPGAGNTTQTAFHVNSAGRFDLRVVVPFSEAERAALHKEHPDVACDLRILLLGADGYRVERNVTVLKNDAWTPDALIFEPAETLLLPSGGDYRLSVENRRQVEIFAARGAMLELLRFEINGHGYRYFLALVAAYVLLGGAAAAVAYGAIRGRL